MINKDCHKEIASFVVGLVYYSLGEEERYSQLSIINYPVGCGRFIYIPVAWDNLQHNPPLQLSIINYKIVK